MKRHPYLQVIAWFVLARLLLGAFFIAVQLSSPGEGAMVGLLDVPALALGFFLGYVIGWPDGFTDMFDPTFHVVGFAAWILLGLAVVSIGESVRRYRQRRAV